MSKVKKTYRIESSLIESLQVNAEKRGISMTEAIEDAIRGAIQMPDNVPDASQTHNDDFVAFLQKQIEVKDQTIFDLTAALREANSNVKQAQALHGGEMMRLIGSDGDAGEAVETVAEQVGDPVDKIEDVTPSEPDPDELGFFQRIWRALKGL